MIVFLCLLLLCKGAVSQSLSNVLMFEPEPVPQPTPKPRRQPSIQSVLMFPSESESAAQPEAQPQPQDQPKPQPQPQDQPEPQPQPEIQPEPQPQLQPYPQTEAQPEPQPKLQPQPQPEAQPQPQLLPQPEQKPQPQSEQAPEPQSQVKAQTCPKSDRPNVLLIMTDDQGHDDIGFYNTNNILKSPNMDKFATQSVQFEDFYTDSLCAPTRASLFTGRHHLKTGVWGVHACMDYINLDETLIAEAMQFNGYKTGFFGKWHSGVTPGYNPWDRGFEEAYLAKLYTFFNNLVKLNGEDVQTQGWIEDWLADRIIEYLQKRSEDGEPFFLTWTPMSIHRGRKFDFEPNEDFVAPEEYYNLYEGQVSSDLVRVFASITYFDDVFGRVINKLDEFGLSDNTIVMFFGDNGPHVYQTDHAFDPNRQIRIPSDMKDEKGFIEENGIRNFLFVRGTDRFPAGQQVFQNIGVIDIYPTILELTGGSTPPQNKPLDGLSFAPLLCEGGSWSHSERNLYFYESLKSKLDTDDLLFLGDDRKVEVSQKLLSYSDGGRDGEGFVTYTGLRWREWKYIKGRLFDLDATNHKEFFNLRTQDSELEGLLSARLSDWWQSVLQSPGAFEKPTFLIGLYGVSPVRSIGVVERSGDHILISSHFIQGFKYSGDFIICRVRVVQTGMYDVNVQFGWSGDKGASVSIRIGEYQQLWDGSATAVSRQIDQNGPLYFGQMFLAETGAGVQQEMIFELERTNSEGEDVFWWIDNIEFTLVQSE
eukprot:TRINITY_DN1536_c0_g1_i1.p1 TRINITY_DN1536_c0_g1~~TRINITY_DN1536_c0_g1_i1.p1  ORF type:complete len:759 (-),score=100.50 TRINITY_DN1536_c0_g1_i1:660-2936(-)